KRGIQQMSITGNAFAQRAAKSGFGPSADSGFGLGRGVGAVDRAERRRYRHAAGVRRAIARRMAAGTVAQDGEQLAAPHQQRVEHGRRGGRDRIDGPVLAQRSAARDREQRRSEQDDPEDGRPTARLAGDDGSFRGARVAAAAWKSIDLLCPAMQRRRRRALQRCVSSAAAGDYVELPAPCRRRITLTTLATSANPAASASAIKGPRPSRVPATLKITPSRTAPMVWPVRRAVPNMPPAAPARCSGALVTMV